VLPYDICLRKRFIETPVSRSNLLNLIWPKLLLYHLVKERGVIQEIFDNFLVRK